MDDNNLLEAPKLPDGYRFKVTHSEHNGCVRVILQRRNKFLLFPFWDDISSCTTFANPISVRDMMDKLMGLHTERLVAARTGAAIQGIYPPKRFIGGSE